jgi:hypothetical protein
MRIMKMVVFWDVAPCNPVVSSLETSDRIYWSTHCNIPEDIHLDVTGSYYGLTVCFCENVIIVLKMEAESTSETSVNVNQTTRCINPVEAIFTVK